MRIFALGLCRGPHAYLRNGYNRLDTLIVVAIWCGRRAEKIEPALHIVLDAKFRSTPVSLTRASTSSTIVSQHDTYVVLHQGDKNCGLGRLAPAVPPRHFPGLPRCAVPALPAHHHRHHRERSCT